MDSLRYIKAQNKQLFTLAKSERGDTDVVKPLVANNFTEHTAQRQNKEMR